MRAKAAATGPLDHHVLELRRREEALKRDMVNDSQILIIGLVLNFALTEVLVRGTW